MIRILSYNILAGGKRRIDQLTKIINSTYPDIVGLIEANSLRTVEELADRLGMQYHMNANPTQGKDWLALLSRLPIVEAHSHIHADILTQPVLEACIEEKDGRRLTVFVAHLSASFYRGRGGDGIRRHEVREILRIIASKRGTPHLLMGDFNAIAPGDRLKASALLRYLVANDLQYRRNPHVDHGHPNLDSVVPVPLRFLYPILQTIPYSKALCALLDRAGSLYTPRGSISMLRKAGYIDCFRLKNPNDPGFTFPAAALAGRIDYIFASPELAERLSACCVVTEGDGLRGNKASDHLPVVAEFGESARVVERPAHGLAIHRPFDLFDNV
jgi:endonuclease/exonuclease/phosphatase family metal-dependent hydrolase